MNPFGHSKNYNRKYFQRWSSIIDFINDLIQIRRALPIDYYIGCMNTKREDDSKTVPFLGNNCLHFICRHSKYFSNFD